MNVFISGDDGAFHGAGTLGGLSRIKSSRPGGMINGFGFTLGPVMSGLLLGFP